MQIQTAANLRQVVAAVLTTFAQQQISSTTTGVQQQKALRLRTASRPKTGLQMIFLMADDLQRHLIGSRQAASNAHAGKKRRHIGVCERTRITADTNSRQGAILIGKDLLYQTRQIAGMLKNHLGLLQAATSRLNA